MRRNYSSYIKRRLRMYLALSPFYSPKTSKSKSTPQFLHRIFILTAIILTGINYASVAIPKKFLFAPGCINVKRQTDKSRSAVKHQNPPRFVLYRLIGNNMPPLQCPSQLLWNTEVIFPFQRSFLLWFVVLVTFFPPNFSTLSNMNQIFQVVRSGG